MKTARKISSASAFTLGNRDLRSHFTVFRKLIIISLLCAGLLLGLTATPALASPSNTRQDASGTLELAGPAWLGGSGVDVYSNGSSAYSGNYQCVELVNRLYATRGWISASWSGNANQMYDKTPSGLAKEAQGSISSIRPGDVICMNGDRDNPYGHVAIVDTVTNNSDGSKALRTVNQNTRSVYMDATLRNGSISMPWLSSYPVQGVVHAPTQALTIPAQPLNPRVTSTTQSSVTLVWAALSSNQTGFKVQYRIGNGAWRTASATAAANATSLTITGLAANTQYTFQVGAYNRVGTKWSAYVNGKTAALIIPAPPLNPRVTSTTQSSVTLVWAALSSNQTGFKVQYRIGNGAWRTASATAAANATSLTITGLAANTQYTFQVGAYNGVGTKWSAYVNGKTAAPTSAPAPVPTVVPVPTPTPAPTPPPATPVVDTNLKKILRDTVSGACYLITASGKKAWIPTGGDYQAMVNNGIQVVQTNWAMISRYPDAGYQAVVQRVDDPIISGPTKWLVFKTAGGWLNGGYVITGSAAGKYSSPINSATWTLTNGRGLVRVNCYVPQFDAKATVVYHVYDGGREVGSQTIRQENFRGKYVQLGTWEFSSGTVTIKVFDHEGGAFDEWIAFDMCEAIPVG